MSKAIIFTRFWRGFTWRFPIDRFNNVPDWDLSLALHRFAEQWSREHPEAVAEQRERAKDQAERRREERELAKGTTGILPKLLSEQSQYEAAGYACGWFSNPKRGEIEHWTGMPDEEWIQQSPPDRRDGLREMLERRRSAEPDSPNPPLFDDFGPLPGAVMTSTTGTPHEPTSTYLLVSEDERVAAGAVEALNEPTTSLRRYGFVSVDSLDNTRRVNIMAAIDNFGEGDAEVAELRGKAERAVHALAHLGVAATPHLKLAEQEKSTQDEPMPRTWAEARGWLVTRDRLLRALNKKGASWLEKVIEPDKVHVAPPRGGYSSLYRVGGLLDAFSEAAGEDLTPLELARTAASLLVHRDSPPPWEKSSSSQST